MKKSLGYTLIELMSMLAVVSILVSIGLPMMNVFFDSNRMISNSNDLVAGINIARSEAIKQQIRVTLCQSADTASCTGSGQWEDGWIVFQDPNGNASVDASERILRLCDRSRQIGQEILSGCCAETRQRLFHTLRDPKSCCYSIYHDIHNTNHPNHTH